MQTAAPARDCRRAVMNRERLPPQGDAPLYRGAAPRGEPLSPYLDRGPDGRMRGEVVCVPHPRGPICCPRPAAPCAARGWSAADEPTLPTSFSNEPTLPTSFSNQGATNGAAGGYSQSELATASGLSTHAGDATAVIRSTTPVLRSATAAPLRMPLSSTWEGGDVDGVQQTAATRLWIPEQYLGPDGSIIPAEKRAPEALVLPPEPVLAPPAPKLPPAEPKPLQSGNLLQSRNLRRWLWMKREKWWVPLADASTAFDSKLCPSKADRDCACVPARMR